jgi:hypothetical protein
MMNPIMLNFVPSLIILVLISKHYTHTHIKHSDSIKSIRTNSRQAATENHHWLNMKMSILDARGTALLVVLSLKMLLRETFGCCSNGTGFPFQLQPATYPFTVASYDNTTRTLFSIVDPETEGIISVIVGDNNEKSFDGIFELDLTNQTSNKIDFSFSIPAGEELSMTPLNGLIQFNFRARVPRSGGVETGGAATNTEAYQLINAFDFCEGPTLAGSKIEGMDLIEKDSFVSITPNVIFTRVIYSVPSDQEIQLSSLTYSVEYDMANVISGSQEYWYSTEDYMEVLASYPAVITSQARHLAEEQQHDDLESSYLRHGS